MASPGVFFYASDPYLFVLTPHYLKQHRLYCRKWEDQKDYQIVNEEPLCSSEKKVLELGGAEQD